MELQFHYRRVLEVTTFQKAVTSKIPTCTEMAARVQEILSRNYLKINQRVAVIARNEAI